MKQYAKIRFLAYIGKKTRALFACRDTGRSARSPCIVRYRSAYEDFAAADDVEARGKGADVFDGRRFLDEHTVDGVDIADFCVIGGLDFVDEIGFVLDFYAAYFGGLQSAFVVILHGDEARAVFLQG